MTTVFKCDKCRCMEVGDEVLVEVKLKEKFNSLEMIYHKYSFCIDCAILLKCWVDKGENSGDC